MTAVTDEFPYYLRPKKAVFSGLICVAMYLMGLVLTTDVSAAVRREGSLRVGWCGYGWRQGQEAGVGQVTLPRGSVLLLWEATQVHSPRAAWPMARGPGFKVQRSPSFQPGSYTCWMTSGP